MTPDVWHIHKSEVEFPRHTPEDVFDNLYEIDGQDFSNIFKKLNPNTLTIWMGIACAGKSTLAEAHATKILPPEKRGPEEKHKLIDERKYEDIFYPYAGGISVSSEKYMTQSQKDTFIITLAEAFIAPPKSEEATRIGELPAGIAETRKALELMAKIVKARNRLLPTFREEKIVVIYTIPSPAVFETGLNIRTEASDSKNDGDFRERVFTKYKIKLPEVEDPDGQFLRSYYLHMASRDQALRIRADERKWALAVYNTDISKGGLKANYASEIVKFPEGLKLPAQVRQDISRQALAARLYLNTTLRQVGSAYVVINPFLGPLDLSNTET